MRKNGGFIATSLLYTFFLVFCALLMNLIASYLHNRVLLNNMTQSIKTELSKAGNRTLACVSTDLETGVCNPVEQGAYIKMTINQTTIISDTSNIKWIVMSDLAAGSNANIEMISDQIFMLSNEYFSQSAINTRLATFNTGTRVSIAAPTINNINSMTAVTDLSIRKILLGAISVDAHPANNVNTPGSFIYYNGTTAFLYKYTCLLSDNLSCQANIPGYQVPNNLSLQYGIRAVLTLYSERKIISGSGTKNNPYVLED